MAATVAQMFLFALFCVVIVFTLVFSLGMFAFRRWLKHGRRTVHETFNGAHDCFWCGYWHGLVARAAQEANRNE